MLQPGAKLVNFIEERWYNRGVSGQGVTLQVYGRLGLEEEETDGGVFNEH